MKKLLIPLLFICGLLQAQEYTETLLWDLTGVTGDSIRSVSYKSKDKGALVEVDFSDVKCNVLELNIGYGSNDQYPMFIDTIPYVSLPVLLDTTVYTTTYLGVETNIVGFHLVDYDANYLWFQLVYDGACTVGNIKLRLQKK